MNAKDRLQKLSTLNNPQENYCNILSNARCLSEGVDVPALDSVIFFDPKQSQNDIIQAIGRVLRKADNKELGYIILPLVLDENDLNNLDEAVEGKGFQGIWKVLCALRSQDDSLVDEREWKKKIKLAIPDPLKQPDKNTQKDINQQGELLLHATTLQHLSKALFNVMPSRMGVERYWRTFGKKTAKITETLIDRIEGIFQRETSLKESYVQALKSAIHPNITETEAVELLASHIVTEPIFKHLFPEGEKDSITKALNKVLEALKNNHLDNETRNLKPLYESVEEQVKNAHSENSKQQVIKNLYGTFFKQAFKKQTERFGIVYTPIEAVNFILRMTRDLTQKHFGKNLNDQGVKIYDPFTGTGSFITALLNKENHFIDDAYVKRKVEEEIFAQDITLLSYYIAGVNIATIAKNRNPACQAFQNLILGDSLNSLERQKARENTKHPTLFDTLGKEIFEALEPNKQKEEQLDREHINIIIGNPPYSGGAGSQNDNNVNLPHPELEQQIKDTYGKEGGGSGETTRDTLIQAIRMATNKIEQNGGIIGFILNGNFLNAKSADGFRKCVVKDFSNIYVINLRGNARTSGETRKKEGDGIFDTGSRATVAICFFVRNPAYQGAAKIHYYAVEDYLTRENKLSLLTSFQTLEDIPFTNITPNNKGDWLNQRNSDFETLIPFKKEKGAPLQENILFIVNSTGLMSSRDAWVYNFSRAQLQKSMETCIATYRADCAAFDKKAFEARTQNIPNANKYKALTDKDITTDSTKISWTLDLKQKLIKQENIPDFNPDSIRTALYRPFVKTNLYWDKTWNESQRQLPKIFPEENLYNRAILIGGNAARDFSVLMTDTLPDRNLLPTTQVFPLYTYTDYGREDNINPYFVKRFQNVLGDHTIGSEDIFYYCYAVFHHKTYTETYANDLAKEAPRVPILKEFQTLAALGRALGDLHCRYEEQTPYDKTTIKEENYRVDKIKRSKDGAKIIYNAFMTLEDIPPQAYAYTINGKSAIDGFIERYQNTMDKDTLVPNDPNAFRGEKYLFDTLCKLITVSLKSVDLIEKINVLPYERVDGG